MSAQDLQDLHRKVAGLLAVPSVYAYARALALVEDHAERAAASSDLRNPVLIQILRACRTYHSLCRRAIRAFVEHSGASEHEAYERRRSSSGSEKSGSESESGRVSPKGGGKRKREGAVFEVDEEGGQIVAALEALRLREREFEEDEDGDEDEDEDMMQVDAHVDVDRPVVKRKRVRFNTI
ncbi:hypothetical protein F5Y14DRAFT_451547 [Nemania sp. NC0429]|nr:hypothetical protein F5Y14DRAFT_451547 [Nemania sp. NC0429]